MNENEIMNIEENGTFEDEVNYTDSNSNAKYVVGFVGGIVTAVVGKVVRKYVFEPLVAKHKAKKKQQAYLEEHGPVLIDSNDETEE